MVYITISHHITPLVIINALGADKQTDRQTDTHTDTHTHTHRHTRAHTHTHTHHRYTNALTKAVSRNQAHVGLVKKDHAEKDVKSK